MTRYNVVNETADDATGSDEHNRATPMRPRNLESAHPNTCILNWPVTFFLRSILNEDKELGHPGYEEEVLFN